MSINLQLPKLTDIKPRLTVVGIGGAGCNAINNMIAAGLTGVEFVVANTDAQALSASSAEQRIQLGINLTEGMGAGARPEIGEAAAEEAIEEIRAQVSGSHMVFLAAGMGGGTGTGAASVIARVAREEGILVVGVVTKPFQFEGTRRMRIAEAGVEELKRCVDTLIVIPNQNLFRIANEKTTFAEAFVLADHVLYSGVACIVDLIIKEGLINLDFADVRAVMGGMGTAMMGTGEAGGERRATIAAEEAISNPLLDDITLRGARGLLLSITGGPDLTLYEVDEAASRVRQEIDPEATIIVGATFDDTLDEKVRVSIVASGMAREGDQQNSGGFMSRGASQMPVPPSPPLHSSTPVEPVAGFGVPETASAGDKPSAMASSDQGAMEASGAVRPPPVPVSQGSEMRRRLSEAMQAVRGPQSSDTSGFDASNAEMFGGDSAPVSADQEGYVVGAANPGIPHYAATNSGYNEPGADPSGGARWLGPGNVTIEEGLPHLHRPVSPPANSGNPSPEFPPAVSQFQAQQPLNAPRRQPRRMPEVEDFPMVGQREYRAHIGSHGATQGQPGNTRDENRKQGFFERLTGFARRQSDSGKMTPVDPVSQRDFESRSSAGMGARDRDDQNGKLNQNLSPDDESTELPVFFSHRSRR